ncbi:MAG: hypothetical protein K0R90_1775 [Oscillospiraceae bacterium]|jgi:hypothetical protein|nr:hypothetical protein [Oscillospiraceae bacterium]
MIETVFIALLIAKLKKLRLKPLLKAYWLYPIFIMDIFGVFLQINIFCGNYAFVRSAALIKTAYMMAYVFPVIRYKLYTQGIVASSFIFIGTMMNKFVMSMNGGKMPVYPSFSKITGYYSEQMFSQATGIHALGNADTKFKILTDYLDIGYSILSLGDVVIRVFVVIILYYSIKNIQEIQEV